MRLRPFFCFYGGKHRIAARYPSPDHRRVVEPFAGSAGYSTLHFERDVLLVDKDETIAALWAYLIRVTSAEVRAIPLLGHDQTIDDVHGAEKARSLVGFWLCKGVASPRRSPSAWMRSDIRPGSFWGNSVRDRIAHQVNFIRHWRVRCASYETTTNLDATWFVDPPYELAGRHYRHSLKPADFAPLSAWCTTRRGTLIACEQVGARWLPFEPFCVAKAMESATGGKRSAEAIFMRRSSQVAA